MPKNRITLAFLAALTAIALYFCYLLVAPFLRPIVFSIILAIVFYPVHARIHRWIRNRDVAAVLSTTAVILFITLAATFLGSAIISGLGDIYQSLSNPGNGKERLSLYIVHLLDQAVGLVNRYSPIPFTEWQGPISNQAEKIVSSLLAASAGVLGSITSLVVNALISFFILYFLLRDGRSMLRFGAVLLPLRRVQIARLFACVNDTLNAILYGTLAIALIQGTLTGMAFSFLGIASPVLWGIVTSLCALLPVIGTAFVFLPALGMLIFNGHWIKGIILLIWAIAVVHPVDNILRPYLIGGRTRLSTLYVFFAVLGGIKAFGSLGLFIGPLVLAMTVALFKFLREESRAESW